MSESVARTNQTPVYELAFFVAFTTDYESVTKTFDRCQFCRELLAQSRWVDYVKHDDTTGM